MLTLTTTTLACHMLIKMVNTSMLTVLMVHLMCRPVSIPANQMNSLVTQMIIEHSAPKQARSLVMPFCVCFQKSIVRKPKYQL